MTRTNPYSTRCVVALVLVLFAGCFSLLGDPVLLWDPNPDANVAGYKVYSGTQSRTYTAVVDVGLQTSNSLSGLNAGITYYFAVTAYTADGLESPFSDEIWYTPPIDGITSALTQTFFAPTNGALRLSFSATIGQQCRVLASSDLATWEEAYGVLMTTNGTVQWVDQDIGTRPMRFYRTVVSPVVDVPGAAGALLK